MKTLFVQGTLRGGDISFSENLNIRNDPNTLYHIYQGLFFSHISVELEGNFASATVISKIQYKHLAKGVGRKISRGAGSTEKKAEKSHY